jgi:hypothetical protein
MVAGDFEPQAKLSQHIKDVELMLEEAARAGQHLPFTELHRELLQRAERAGLGDLDNSAIIRVLDGELTGRAADVHKPVPASFSDGGVNAKRS